MEDYFKIGHRGAKGYVAENTLESIEYALNLGVSGIEIDVHVCASGELVVFHDFTLDRITNGSGNISDFTLSELKKLKVCNEYTIPTLHEVMKVVDRDCLLNIELKGKKTPKAISKFVNLYVEEKGWKYRDILISSFQPNLLVSLRKMNEMVMLGVLTDTNLDEALSLCRYIEAVSVHPDYTMLTKKNVERFHAENYQVITWTVNDEKSIELVKSYGVDGIISDFPDRL